MYVEAVCVAGATVEIERYYTGQYRKQGQKRKPKQKESSEEIKAKYNRRAEKKLRRLINANFSPGDYHLTLSYKKNKGDPERSPEEMKEDIRKFLRGMRKDCKDRGIELKYIHVPEIGEKGARHHHLVINKVDTDIISKNWKWGFFGVRPLDSSRNWRRLAAYLLKYSCKAIGTEFELSGKRWNASRNLIHPVPTVTVITKRDYFKQVPVIPRKYRGKYEVDKETIESGEESSEYDYGYFRYTLVRIDR